MKVICKCYAVLSKHLEHAWLLIPMDNCNKTGGFISSDFKAYKAIVVKAI